MAFPHKNSFLVSGYWMLVSGFWILDAPLITITVRVNFCNLKSALTFFERDRFKINTMRYRDVFINIRPPIRG